MHEKLEKLEKLKKLFDDGIISEEEYSDLKKEVISSVNLKSEIRTEEPQPINCSSCGAVNQLTEGASSIFCSFCGTLVERKMAISTENNTISFQSNNNNPIIAKPQISQRKINMVPGKPDTRFWSGVTSLSAQKRRVDGGFEYWTGNSWSFCEDVEEIVDEGGELSLVNRNISSFEQIAQWFSDSELKDIKRLILEKNNINSFAGIKSFKNLRELDLSFNKINTILNSDIGHIDTLILKGNPIEKIDSYRSNLPDNITFNNGLHCYKCRYHITEKMDKANGGICNNCDKIKKKERKSKEEINAIINDPLMQKAFRKPQPTFLQLFAREMGGDCFIATATMGSYDHPVVVQLRLFRDNWILKKSWGYGFVKWYYHYGAKAAKVIEKSLILKKLSYFIIVKPLYIISKEFNKK